jgi:monoamine oxidase
MSAKNFIVIGAGAAGIAAARHLREQGQRVAVLEARSRVGGRAWTDTASFGFPVDMGCAWLHSAEVNPWTSYAQANGFRIIERLPVWQRRVGREPMTPEYREAWHAAYERNEALAVDAAQAGRDVAMSSLLPNDEFRPSFDAVMTWLMGTESEYVSSLDLSRYADTGMNWAVYEGLGTVVTHAARGLHIHLETAVQLIDWSGPIVRLTTTRGTLEADGVIVTVPTPALADERSIRFVPALPAELRDAFATVPLGICNKVFIEMEPGALPFEGSEHFIGTMRTRRTASYQTRPSDREVLLAFFGGSLARELEERGELAAFARNQLMEIFGPEFVTRIRRTACTGWGSDPWSRGVYSAALPGMAHMRERLGSCLAGRVCFAGEAASIESFGTIHGAWDTGVRAAQLLLQPPAH